MNRRTDRLRRSDRGTADRRQDEVDSARSDDDGDGPTSTSRDRTIPRSRERTPSTSRWRTGGVPNRRTVRRRGGGRDAPARLLGVVAPGVLGITVATLLVCLGVEAALRSAFRTVVALEIVESRPVVTVGGSDPFGVGSTAIQTVQSGLHGWSVAVAAVLVLACCWAGAVAVAHAVARIRARS